MSEQASSSEVYVLPTVPKLGDRQPVELSPSMALVAAVFEIALEDPAYSRYANLPSNVEAGEVTAHRAEKSARGEAAYWAILPASGQIAGIFELWFRDQSAGVLEAGYWVAEPHRHNGYATSALRLITVWVDKATTAERIELAIHPENSYSRQLAETVGYRHIGSCTPSAPGAPRDVFYELYTWERTGT